MTIFNRDIISEFSKDLKKLRINNIEEDLKVFEKAFNTLRLQLPDIHQIPDLHRKGISICVYKARKFRVRSMNLGSNSGVRIIFVYFKEQDKFIYVEIYKKNVQENHNENRIIKYFKGKTISDFS